MRASTAARSVAGSPPSSPRKIADDRIDRSTADPCTPRVSSPLGVPGDFYVGATARVESDRLMIFGRGTRGGAACQILVAGESVEPLDCDEPAPCVPVTASFASPTELIYLARRSGELEVAGPLVDCPHPFYDARLPETLAEPGINPYGGRGAAVGARRTNRSGWTVNAASSVV